MENRGLEIMGVFVVLYELERGVLKGLNAEIYRGKKRLFKYEYSAINKSSHIFINRHKSVSTIFQNLGNLALFVINSIL